MFVMNDYGRRLTLHSDFETTVGAVSRAIFEEGLHVLSRTDVREHFWKHLSRDFRRYSLIDAWSPELALETLRNNLDAGTIFTTAFAIYEIGESDTAVVVKESFSELVLRSEWRRENPALANIADGEHERISRILERLQRASRQQPTVPSAA
jgi:uncharacterized protein (DUF302 family)